MDQTMTPPFSLTLSLCPTTTHRSSQVYSVSYKHNNPFRRACKIFPRVVLKCVKRFSSSPTHLLLLHRLIWMRSWEVGNLPTGRLVVVIHPISHLSLHISCRIDCTRSRLLLRLSLRDYFTRLWTMTFTAQTTTFNADQLHCISLPLLVTQNTIYKRSARDFDTKLQLSNSTIKLRCKQSILCLFMQPTSNTRTLQRAQRALIIIFNTMMPFCKWTVSDLLFFAFWYKMRWPQVWDRDTW